MLAIPPHFHQDPDGFWTTTSTTPVSYPAGGSEACFRLEDRSYWFQHRGEAITALVKHHLPSGLILDIGGGNGVMTRRFCDEGYASVLLEPSIEACRIARSARRVDLVLNSTLEEAALPPACADAAGLFDVIEHIPDDRACLREVHRVLKPGGLLFVAVPAFPFLWSINDDAAGHFRRYTRASLARSVEGLFDVVFSSYLFSCLLPPLALFRSLPHRLGLSRKPLLDEAREHGVHEGPAVKVIRSLLRTELTRLRGQRPIPFGTSCLLVARRRDTPT